MYIQIENHARRREVIENHNQLLELNTVQDGKPSNELDFTMEVIFFFDIKLT
jgi:hypothetical protein